LLTLSAKSITGEQFAGRMGESMVLAWLESSLGKGGIGMVWIRIFKSQFIHFYDILIV
jgi:hypothetical protein